MPRFKLEPHFSSSWAQRLADSFQPRLGIYHVPILEADQRDTLLLETSIPDGGLSVPLKPQKLGYHQNLGSRLLKLPPELLVQVMLILPHTSLYMVRRTCRALRNLTDDFQFKTFRTEILQQGEEHSCLTKGGFGELRTIKRILLRSSLCGPCGRLFDSGELERKLKELWRPFVCKGCRNYHPALIFPQGQQGGNICVGLLGKLSVCKHLKVSGKMKPYSGDVKRINCTDPEHVLIDRKDSGNYQLFKYTVQVFLSTRGMERLPLKSSDHSPWQRSIVSNIPG